MLLLLTTSKMPAEAELPELIRQLPEWRREQALRYKHYLGQRNCTLSYLLLALSISPQRRSDLSEGVHLVEPSELFEPFEPLEPFAYGEHGKPYLPSHPEIHFNLSHCRNAVACIIDTVPVGIDVEDLGRYSEGVARYAMNEDEMHEIQSNIQSPSPLGEGRGEAFTRLWTQKEAILKLLGTGITDNMKDVLLPENTKNIEITTEEHLEEGFVLSYAKYK